jgi:hypothetical protein
MSKVRRINVSQIEGNNSNDDNDSEIRPFGEVGFYTNEDGQTDKLELLMFDGVRTHIKSKILGPGVFYGSNADSGDGAGLDTIKLIPDAALYRNDGSYGNDQYLIVDPTVPNHIHLRAGGTIDDSGAALIVGGENSNFEVQAGPNPPVYVRSNNNTWMFDVDGSLLFPGNLVLPDANFVGIPGEVPPTEPAILFPVPGFDGGKIQITSSGLELSAETYTWTFGVVDGSLTFPDSTVQTTAFAGNAATVDIANTDGLSTTYYPTFVESRDGNEILRADADLTYRTDTNTLTAGNISVTGSLNTGENLNFTSTEGTDTARIFAEASGLNSSLVLEVGDDNPDKIVLRHFSFGVGTIDMLTARRLSNTEAEITVEGDITATGTVTAAIFSGNGTSLTGVATKDSGTWIVPPGNSFHSIIVPINGVYQLWVRGNIPNGIISYIATVNVTNSNVPVLGTQRAWNYIDAGSPILLTSLPAQIIGTEGQISTVTETTTPSNSFAFGITNNTLEDVTVAYGYTKIS